MTTKERREFYLIQQGIQIYLKQESLHAIVNSWIETNGGDTELTDGQIEAIEEIESETFVYNAIKIDIGL